MSRVTIFNRNDGDPAHAALVSSRLSNSVVSLLNYHGTALKTYRIGDATDVPSFDISFVSQSGILITNAPTNAPTDTPTATPTFVPTQPPSEFPTTNYPTFDPTLVHKVRIQLEGRNYLHLREVQVFDYNDVNVALNKVASQSSTYPGYLPASAAVDGNMTDFSHTYEEQGTLNRLLPIASSSFFFLVI